MVIEDVVAARRTLQAATGGLRRPSSGAEHLELRRRSGVARSAVRGILRGRRGIGLSAAKRFAASFGWAVEEFS